MELDYILEGTKATITIAGKLLVSNASELEDTIVKLSQEAVDFVIDFTNLEYITSAGLRVLITAHKLAGSRGGTLKIINPSDDVMEVLEFTGLTEVLEISR